MRDNGFLFGLLEPMMIMIKQKLIKFEIMDIKAIKTEEEVKLKDDPESP